MPDNLHHAQYDADGNQVDDSQVTNRLNSAQVTAFNEDGTILSPDGAIRTLSELLPAPTTIAGPGTFNVATACEFAGWYCSVAAGTITVYNALTATGTPFIPAEAAVVGPRPVMGPGTNSVVEFSIGCTVVLSAAATLQVFAE